MSGTKIQKFRLRDQIASELEAAGTRSAPKIAAPAATGSPASPATGTAR